MLEVDTTLTHSSSGRPVNACISVLLAPACLSGCCVDSSFREDEYTCRQDIANSVTPCEAPHSVSRKYLEQECLSR